MKRLILITLIIYYFTFSGKLFAANEKLEDIKIISNNPEKAINLLKKSLNSSNKNYLIYKNLGLAYLFAAKYDSAIVYFNKSLKKINIGKKKKEYIDILNNIGLCYYHKLNYKNAYTFFNKANYLSKKNSYKEGLADSYNNLGNLYWKTAQYKKALKYYNKALNIYKDIKDEKSFSSALNNIGNTYYKLKDYKSAVNFYLKALIKKQEIGENPLSALNNIAALYVKLKEYQKALTYLKKALLYCSKNDKKNLSLIYLNMGSIYSEMNADSTAIIYLKKSLKLKNEINDIKGISIILNEIGSIFTKQNNFKKALEYYSKSYQIRKKLSDYEGMAKILFNIGKIYFNMKNLNKAKNYLLEAKSILENTNDYENLINIYIKLAEIEKLKKNYKLALDYSNKVITYKDSLFKIKNEKQIRELLTKYEMEKKERQIEILSKNNKIKELTLERQKNLLLFSLIFLLASIGFIFYVWKMKQKEIYYQKLKQRKTEIEKQELERRVQEELKKTETQRQLLIQKSKLESLGKLSAGIAHEINQPLGGISMALENIYFSLIENDEDEKYFLEKLDDIKKYIKRISKIINHIKIFSRDQAIEKAEPFNPIESIENAISIIGTQYKKHGISIIKNFMDKSCYIMGNKYKLEQVFLNLFTNAKDALDEKKENFEKKIEITVKYSNNQCVIELSDNGVGIPKEIKDKIFDPFFTTKSPEKGTGLGLSIVYGIIKEMNGIIKVETDKNKTKFIIIFPVVKK